MQVRLRQVMKDTGLIARGAWSMQSAGLSQQLFLFLRSPIAWQQDPVNKGVMPVCLQQCL